jgi:DNA polymerase III subunit epsilon
MPSSPLVGLRSRRVDPAQLSLFDPSAAPSRVATQSGPSWTEGELLCFDLETTGVDRFGDVPVSLALLRLRRGAVLERTVGLVDPGRPIPEGATAVHGITDEEVRLHGMTLASAIELVAEALVGASQRGVPVVGVKLDYDLTMIDVLCRGIDGRGLEDRGWSGPVLDALVLDRHVDQYRKGRRTLTDLCQLYGIRIGQAHAADSDAAAAGGVLLAMASRYEELSRATPNELHIAQMEYHREWVTSYDQWRRTRGLDPLDPTESSWPLARLPQSEQGAA